MLTNCAPMYGHTHKHNRLRMVQKKDTGEVCHVRIFADYWLINKTGVRLHYLQVCTCTYRYQQELHSLMASLQSYIGRPVRTNSRSRSGAYAAPARGTSTRGRSPRLVRISLYLSGER
jgi:hypothetical protein